MLLATEPYNRRLEQLDGSLYPEDEPARVTAWNHLLRVVALDHPDVEVVELGARIFPEGRLSWTAGGYQVRSDGLHLTPPGSRAGSRLAPPAAGRSGARLTTARARCAAGAWPAGDPDPTDRVATTTVAAKEANACRCSP